MCNAEVREERAKALSPSQLTELHEALKLLSRKVVGVMVPRRDGNELDRLEHSQIELRELLSTYKQLHAEYERAWSILADGLAEHVAAERQQHYAIKSMLRDCPLVNEAQVLQALSDDGE